MYILIRVYSLELSASHQLRPRKLLCKFPSTSIRPLFPSPNCVLIDALFVTSRIYLMCSLLQFDTLLFIGLELNFLLIHKCTLSVASRALLFFRVCNCVSNSLRSLILESAAS